ncbi:hypothetical protein DDZ13_01475 [Coraliomargarita sinensis]|uniref:Uncharacterized protein n=1 Tax=Coraliomargarita sinensis TaxID=2174842 RepID=A0A317ZQ78_9BACT|nr:hypothetical protein [Coraliomargarita sinensis]PXA05571.1 hypothetical protein DDZ13_01475 [Coraliomargarita sinensis]
MANSTKDSGNKVSLEELLRFKKAEQPDQEFWKEFDSELHQRMMQTLVKKDPWPVQLLRGISGKFAQTTAIGAAAAILALMAIRPAFVASGEQGEATMATASIEQSVAPEASEDDLNTELMAEADYKIEVLSAASAHDSDVVTQDFGLDRIEVASYESDAYSADMSLSGFTSTGVASLVY